MAPHLGEKILLGFVIAIFLLIAVGYWSRSRNKPNLHVYRWFKIAGFVLFALAFGDIIIHGYSDELVQYFLTAGVGCLLIGFITIYVKYRKESSQR
jgi:quinol-cytochrome oxidoreductase complex cytochrome b subunit